MAAQEGGRPRQRSRNLLNTVRGVDHPEWLIEPYEGNGRLVHQPRSNTNEAIQQLALHGTEGIKLARYSFHGNNFYAGSWQL